MPGRRQKNTTTNDNEEEGSNNPKKSPPSSSSSPPPPPQTLPKWLQKRKNNPLIFNYNTTRYPFQELLANWLEVPCNSSDLEESMHKSFQQKVQENSNNKEPLHPQIKHAYISSKMKPELSSTVRHAKKKGLFTSSSYQKFLNTYRLFVREVIAPLCYEYCTDVDNAATTADNTKTTGEEEEEEEEEEGNELEGNESIHNGYDDKGVIYQSPPTIRVVFPNGNKTIALHSDSDYPNHEPTEINFWLPVTNVDGSNSLWVESEPLKNDFQPLKMSYGECFLFDGYNCRHYTVKNDSSGSCRVSFDFRVVPSCFFVMKTKKKESDANGCSSDTVCKYTVGDFCMEQTVKDGCIAYWTHSKKSKSPVPSSKGVYISLESLMESSSLDSV